MKWLAKLFGFGEKHEDEKTYDELLSDLAKPSKHSQIQQSAYQALLKDLNAADGKTHPFEADIKVDCLKVDAKMSHHFSSTLDEGLKDAQYLSALLTTGLSAELEQSTYKNIENSLKQAISQNDGEAGRLKKELAEAQTALKIFKGANGITHPAEYPESSSNSFFIIGSIGVIEAVCNSFFLRESNSTQMALILALGAAAINVIGNAWLGARYRNKNLLDKKKSASGQICFFYSIALILIINSAIAFYRAFLVSYDLNGNFLFESLILFAIGIGLGIAAFNKGYGLDDPFPGYGALDRKVKALEAQLVHLREQHAKFASDLIGAANSNLNRLDQKIVNTTANFQNKLPEIGSEIEKWKKDRQTLEFVYKQLIEVFRTTYIANHSTGAADYKNTPVNIDQNPRLELMKEQLNLYVSRRKELELDIKALRQEVADTKSNLSKWLDSSAGQKLINWP